MERDYAINFLRGVAIFFVVASHSLYVSVDGSVIYWDRLLGRLLGDGTTIFVLISGFLFYHLIKKFEYKDFLFNKLKNVFIPYVVVSIPAILIYVLGYKTQHYWIDMDWFGDLSSAVQVLFLYITGGHLGPLWFVPMILTIFLLSSFSKFLIESLPALILFFVCILISCTLPRPPDNSNIIFSFLHFYPIYIVGGVLCKSKSYWLVKISTFYGLVCLFFMFIGLLLLYQYGVLFPSFIDKVVLFLLFYALFSKYEACLKNSMSGSFLNLLAVFSFPIFFIHGYLIYMTTWLWADSVFDSVFSYLVAVCSVVMFSLIMSLVLAYCTGIIFKDKSRYIVGLSFKEYQNFKSKV